MPPSDTPADIPSVVLGDSDVVLRRVPIRKKFVGLDTESGALILRSGSMMVASFFDGCSVASQELLLSKGGTVADFAEAALNPTEQAVAAFQISDVRRHGFDVVHRPNGLDAVGYAHAEIVIPEPSPFADRSAVGDARDLLLEEATFIHGADELRDLLS